MRLVLPKTIEQAYHDGLGDGAVYAVAVMGGREKERRDWLDHVTKKKRALAALQEQEK
ncbi:hypothetical protein L598_000700001290 [Mesorhizobium sp. J18]|uniref:hypothetical protein n=1 Tax=Mesorhizobium sp. J18 TaxID=935263 RepID=UPI00119C4EAE|nr:hypothetical protein [Mesorhizobium sp. J18]TWG90372.1 hypothetical protein L598_000700001290 [Mesorhizobium sp. J18]